MALEQIARFNGKVKGKKLNEGQSEKLKSVGVVKNMSRLDIAWEELYSEAKKYYSEHGNLNVRKIFYRKTVKTFIFGLSVRRKTSARVSSAEKKPIN